MSVTALDALSVSFCAAEIAMPVVDDALAVVLLVGATRGDAMLCSANTLLISAYGQGHPDRSC